MTELQFRAAVYAAGGPAIDIADVAPDALVRVLRRHKLVSAAQGLPGLTDAQRDALRPDWRAAAAANLAQASERDRVIASLHADTIPCIAYKGVVLQEWLHGRVDGRDSEDLDIWVPPLLFRRTCRWAVGDGYQLAFDLTLDDLNAQQLPSELLLLHPGGMHLDVHQRFFAPHYALEDAEAYLESFVPWLTEDQPVEIARFDDLATTFVVALTGGKDTWASLRHLSDLALAVKRVDPLALAELADRTHTRKLVDTGIHLARHFLGAELDWEPRYEPYGDADAALLEPTELSVPARGRIYAASRERTRDRLAYATRLPFKVSALDIRGASPWVPRPLRRVSGLLKRHGADAVDAALSGSLRRTDG